MCLTPSTLVVVITILKKLTVTVSLSDRDVTELSPRKQLPLLMAIMQICNLEQKM